MLLALIGVVVLAVLLAVLTYQGIERLGRKALVPMVCRAVAWAAIGVLLANLSCAVRPTSLRPLVFLDASLSLSAAGGKWTAAKRLADSLGDVRLINVRPGAADSAPSGGRSSIAPALSAAGASGRIVWLVSDGEVEDAAELPADLMSHVGIRVLPRDSVPDLAIVRVVAPTRLTSGDTLVVDVDVVATRSADRRRVAIEVREARQVWLRGSVDLVNGAGRTTLRAPLPAVAAGPHLLEVALVDARDAESRTDQRLILLSVAPTPGLVVVARPASWESKFFFGALRDVAQLPVRGYMSADQGQWRRIGDMRPASAAEVDQAAQRADVLVTFGEAVDLLKTTRARGRWEWTATARSGSPISGDWYLSAGGASPIAGAFLGLPLDSFPPASTLTTLTPSGRDWIGLTAQQNRRGVERPAIIGRDSAGRRDVLVAVGGLWRWAFRGGTSEQAYRAWIGATTSWLLGSSDSATGRARPVEPVVQQGRPVVFERTRPDSVPVVIDLRGPVGTGRDTLRFDGTGRAEVYLAPGRYDYRLERGGAGVVAVESYSDELLPRSVVLAAHPPTVTSSSERSPFREKWWLFAVAVAALSVEWFSRRRMGLR